MRKHTLTQLLASRSMLLPGSALEPGLNELGGRVQRVEVEGGKATVVLREDGIMQLVWNSQVRIGTADARAAMAAVNQVAGGDEYPLLVDMSMAASVSQQARAVFGGRCAATRIALLGSSPVDRILANWVLSAQKQPHPKRFFNSADEATKWLLQADDGDHAGGPQLSV